MGFKVRKTANRSWPVTIALQEGDAAGQVVDLKQTFVARFKPFSEAQFGEALAAIEREYPAPDTETIPVELTLARAAAFYPHFVTGWGPEVTDETGNPLPYSSAALADLLTGPDGLAVMLGFSAAIAELRFGRAAEKNLPTSAALGGSSSAVEVSPATVPISPTT